MNLLVKCVYLIMPVTKHTFVLAQSNMLYETK